MQGENKFEQLKATEACLKRFSTIGNGFVQELLRPLHVCSNVRQKTRGASVFILFGLVVVCALERKDRFLR